MIVSCARAADSDAVKAIIDTAAAFKILLFPFAIVFKSFRI